MTGNTVTALLRPGAPITTRPLYQYDYGQTLLLTGQELPAAYEVHFCNDGDTESTTSIGGAEGVEIPDAYLLSGANIRAWLYLHEGEDDGETRYEIIIPVIPRAAITNAEPTPVQRDTIAEIIAALTAAVTQAEGISQAIPQTIADALAGAKQSGDFDGPQGERGPQGVTGATGATGAPGQNGADGVSPTVTVSAITGGHRLTITDVAGTRTLDVMDGTNGTDGADGEDGADGVSPVVSVAAITGGHQISVTGKGGTSTVDVMDGTNGTDGQDGASAYEIAVAHGFTGSEADWLTYLRGQDGQDGTGYVLTLQDKQEIVNMVLAELANRS